MRKLFSRFMILVGLLLIVASLGLTAYNIYDSKRAEKASKEVMEKVDQARESLQQEVEEGETPLYELYPQMPMPAVEIDGYRYVGVLKIPSINLELPVMEEWDYDRLKIAPCVFQGSAYTNDLVIAGHNYSSHFSPIKRLEDGADIIFEDMSGNVFNYRVINSDIIDPNDLEGMVGKIEESNWDLTLFTCTTGGGSRCAVRCELIKDE